MEYLAVSMATKLKWAPNDVLLLEPSLYRELGDTYSDHVDEGGLSGVLQTY